MSDPYVSSVSSCRQNAVRDSLFVRVKVHVHLCHHDSIEYHVKRGTYKHGPEAVGAIQ